MVVKTNGHHVTMSPRHHVTTSPRRHVTMADIAGSSRACAMQTSKNCMKTEKNRTPLILKTTRLSTSTFGNVEPRMAPNSAIRPMAALNATSDRDRSLTSRMNSTATCATNERSNLPPRGGASSRAFTAGAAAASPASAVAARRAVL